MEKSLDFVEQWAEENDYVIVSSDMWAIAQDTMRKYQKIQEIFDRYDKGELTHNMFGLLVGEVIEDGKND